ncbi:MAG: Isochorismatase family protein [Xanthobacteraceae bacterium]|nr:Isochorismatase family protein [Xanthobacteraceae bacterium]
MTKYPWDDYLTERDKKVFSAAGFASRAGFGKRPAVIVVDVNYNFVGDKPEPILESIKEWSLSCGEEGWTGIRAIQKILAAARPKGVPVIYTTGTLRDDGFDAGSWAWKNARTVEDIGKKQLGNEIVADIAPQPQDLVIRKQKPSGFFGTPLMSFLTDLNVDSLIVTGTTTSGCVYATVVDAFSYNLRSMVVEEGCFDRGQASHAMALMNMNAKYADVIKLDETLSYLNGLPVPASMIPKKVANM